MKLPILLGALLLSASPAFAEDLVYLKCNGTVLMKQIDTTEKVELTKEVTMHYKIDTKKKLLLESHCQGRLLNM